jgi:hypothetical protein
VTAFKGGAAPAGKAQPRDRKKAGGREARGGRSVKPSSSTVRMSAPSGKAEAGEDGDKKPAAARKLSVGAKKPPFPPKMKPTLAKKSSIKKAPLKKVPPRKK